MNQKLKSYPLVSQARLKKIRDKYPDLFRFDKSGLLDANSEAGDLCDALMVSMIKCSDAAFKAHLNTLSHFARGGNCSLYFLAGNKNLKPDHKILVGQTLVDSLLKSVSDLERLTKHSIEQLEKAKKNRPDISANAISLIELIARENNEWPVLMPRNNKAASDQRDFVIKKLGLAKNSVFNIAGKKAFPKMKGQDGKKIISPGHSVAVEIINQIHGYRSDNRPAKFHTWASDDLLKEARRLPLASIQTRKAWWAVGRQVMINIYGAEFWKHYQFRPYLDKKDGKDRTTLCLTKVGSLKVRVENSVKSCFFSYYKPFSR